MPGLKMRLLSAVAGIVTAAGLSLPGTLSPAAAVPRIPLAAPITWSAEHGPVPKAGTHTVPALATITLPGSKTRRLLFWTGPAARGGGFQISYQAALNLQRNLWSAQAAVDSGKATTRARPGAAPIGKAGAGQVIVVWKEATGSSVMYSIGKAGKGTTLTWGAAAAIPRAATSNGPAVYSALDSDAVIVAWKDVSSDSIDFVVGIPAGPVAVKWGKVGVIQKAVTKASTTTTPAITEANTGKTTGSIYVLWKTAGTTGHIDFAVTTDPLSAVPKWTKPRSLPPAVSTPSAPSADAVGKGVTFPLLIVFQKAGGPTLDYVIMTAHGTVTGPFKVPHIQSANGTTISHGVLAAEAPGLPPAANLQNQANVFYEPYVRPCAGC